VGRGDFDAARANLSAALPALGEDHAHGFYDILRAELGLWERRWLDADQAVRESLVPTRSGRSAHLRVWYCAKGLRAQAELAGLARARRDADEVRRRLDQADDLVAKAWAAAAEAEALTPNAESWLAVAEAEYARARADVRPELWSVAAVAWQALRRPPLVAYCRWREAEGQVATGASRTEASSTLREAYAIATRIGARPLVQELELLATRARLDLAPDDAEAPKGKDGLDGLLGLTPREAEVLALVARGLTNREIAAELVISEKTAGIHVSHILQKLGAPNRREAAAIVHRVSASLGTVP
jgi:DNA-binding NarL/FixJ family response regulator